MPNEPIRPEYGFRYGTREVPDDQGWGTVPPHDDPRKGRGYYGELQNAQGQFVSEFSVGVTIDGQNYHVPSLVPGLRQEEIDAVLAGEVPIGVQRKAEEWAAQRLREGKPVFATPDEEGQYKPIDAEPKPLSVLLAN